MAIRSITCQYCGVWCQMAWSPTCPQCGGPWPDREPRNLQHFVPINVEFVDSLLIRDAAPGFAVYLAERQSPWLKKS